MKLGLVVLSVLVLSGCALTSKYAFQNPEPELTYKRTYWAQELNGKWKEYPTYQVNGEEHISSKLAYKKDADGRLRIYTRDGRPGYNIMEIRHEDPEAINWLCHYKYRVKADQPVLGCAIPFSDSNKSLFGERVKGIILLPTGNEWIEEHERNHLLYQTVDFPKPSVVFRDTHSLGPRLEQRIP